MGEDALKQLLPILALASCTTVPEGLGSLSIEEAVEQRAELDGKVVRIAGVVRHCQRLSCTLHSPNNKDHWLSIGSSDEFDRAVGSVLGRRIVVEATFRDKCIVDFIRGNIGVCADRSETLENPILVWPKSS